MRTNFLLVLIVCFSLNFTSCNKEKLEGDATLLIGKWKAIKYVKSEFYFGDCIGMTIDNCPSNTMEFKKNKGKVLLNEYTVEEKFFVKVKDISEKMDFNFFYGCSAAKLDSIDSYHKITPIIKSIEVKAEENYEVYYYVNNEKLIILTELYSEYYRDYDGYHYYVYERIE